MDGPKPVEHGISKIFRDGEGEYAQDYLWFWCGGCETHHRVPVTGQKKWCWNGSTDKPTLTPSILVKATRSITDEEAARILAGEALNIEKTVCHSFVTDGRIQYLADCTHPLAGQTRELEPLP